MLAKLGLLILAAERRRGFCLTNGQLMLLGLVPQNRTVYSGGSLCSTYFTSMGSCANATSVSAKLVSDMRDLRLKMAIISKLYTIFDVVGGILKATITNTTLSGSNMTNATLSNYTIAQITTDLGYIKGNATTNYPKCFNTLALLQMGTTCMLSSGGASAGAVTDSSIFNVTFNAALDGQQVENDCLPVYDALCTIIAGQSLLYPSINGTVPSISDAAMVFANACRSLRPYNTCNASPPCILAKQQQLVSTLIRPYEYAIFPSLDYLATLSLFFANIGTQFQKFFNLRLLSTSLGPIVYFNAGITGKSLYAVGANSGVTPATALGGQLAATLGVAALFLIWQ